MDLIGALTAAGWGAVAGLALLVGAAAALVVPVRLPVIGGVMGFGAGVLIGAVTLELTVDAMQSAGLLISGLAMIGGALVYVAGDWAVSNAGAHRRNSPIHGGTHPDRHHKLTREHREGRASAPAGSRSAVGSALVLGALLDGIPESAAIGIGLLDGGQIGVAFLAAVFLSNLPEGLAATSGLRAAGHSARSVMGLWSAVVAASAVAAGAGFLVLGGLGPGLHGGIQAFAAGAVLAMIAATMLPEAVDHAGRLVGLVTVLGFAASVLLSAV